MSNVFRETLWAILCIGFCVATPRILTSDNSCPCHPIEQCPGNAELLSMNSQVPMLPCESELLTRCCTVVPKPIESIKPNGFVRNIDTEDQVAKKSETKEKPIDESTTLMESTVSEAITYADESMEEYSTTEASISTPLEEIFSPTTQISTDSGMTNANDETDRNATLSSTTENIPIFVNAKKAPTSYKPIPGRRRNQLRYLNATQFLEPRTIRIRIINESTTALPSPVRIQRPEKPMRQQKVKEETPEGRLIADEEKLISQAIRFESTKILKKLHLNERLVNELKGMTRQKIDSNGIYREN